MIEIKEVELINDGYFGIKITGRELVNTADDVVKTADFLLDKVQRTRGGSISSDLRKNIGRLKYFYLSITGHWLPPFDKFLNRENSEYTLEHPEEGESEGTMKTFFMLKKIWDQTKIKKFSVDENAFSITGSIEVVESKPVNITTPKITWDDDLGFHADALSVLEDCVKSTIGHIESKALKAPKESRDMLSIYGNDKIKEKLDTMSDQEVQHEAIKVLDKAGYIILSMDDEDHVRALEQARSDDDKEDDQAEEVPVRTGTIDSDRVGNDSDDDFDQVPEPEQEEEDEFEKLQPDINKDAFPPPASQKDFRDVGVETAPAAPPDYEAEYSGNSPVEGIEEEEEDENWGS